MLLVLWKWLCNRSNEAEWQRIHEIADRLKSPNAHHIYVGAGYSKRDLRIDLVSAVPTWVKRK